ncbi:MAG TPA: DNA replication and repair protein RecF [Acidimicrobiia bacterium]|nr:DNA replication and repair protein RecF [Acidimicrobiia bacterium]
MNAGTARVARVWLNDFRCFHELDVEFAPGLTVLFGANAVGKTSLLEAVAWAARAKSFRGVPDSALVRSGCDEAILRAEVQEGERRQLLEVAIRASGANRVLLNRNRLTRTRDLAGLVRVTVFAPDDLELVKGGPSGRRDLLDDLLGGLAARYDAARGDYERVLRHRNALLRSGIRDEDDRTTLTVFDEQLVQAGTELVRGRVQLVERLLPVLTTSYAHLAGRESAVEATYVAEWSEEPIATTLLDAVAGVLRDALERKRKQEIDRGVTLVGPHRDELRLRLDDLDARTHASQGEQRSLALALRLAGHHVTADLTDVSPVLLLDDVFSELDAARADALVRELPPGQTLLTTASAVPPGVDPEQRLRIVDGTVRAS